MRSQTLWKFDLKIRAGLSPGARLAGVDEVGVGPLAGPVVAAAVILTKNAAKMGLNDSKLVPKLKREKLFYEILRSAMVGIGVAEVSEIDTLNIYHAARLAMKRAVLSLPCTPALVLIDGRGSLQIPIAQKAIVKGDTKSACIAAASIIAKVYRDAWMESWDLRYPQYFFKNHKGYGTRSHLKALETNGPSPIHRRSFAPVRKFFEPAFL